MPSAERQQSKLLVVVGAGFMGWQIALQSALHGWSVRLVDVADRALEQAAESQRAELQSRVERGQITADKRNAVLGRLACFRRLEEAVAGADLVIEATPERLEMKREIFKKLDDLCPEQVILATNSSSIRISEIEDAVVHKHRVLNMHFFGCVWEKPMAELMGGSATSGQTLEAASAFVESIGLTPLLVLKPSTGFIFNRVWRAIKKECMRVADQGVATVEDVDRAWMIFMNHEIGPFGFMDVIGLDVIRDIEMVYYRESGDPADAPPRILLERVERGDLGVKTGKGFYKYPEPAFEQPGFLRGRRGGGHSGG